MPHIGKIVHKGNPRQKGKPFREYVQIRPKNKDDENLDVPVEASVYPILRIEEAIDWIKGNTDNEVSSRLPLHDKYKLKFGYPVIDKHHKRIYYDPAYCPWYLAPLNNAYSLLEKARDAIEDFIRITTDKRHRCLECGTPLEFGDDNRSLSRHYCNRSPDKQCEKSYKARLKRWRKYVKHGGTYFEKAEKRHRRKYPGGKKHGETK